MKNYLITYKLNETENDIELARSAIYAENLLEALQRLAVDELVYENDIVEIEIS